MVRHGVALAVALLLIGAGVLYVRWVERSIEQRFRQTLREEKAAGYLPPEIDPEEADIADFNVPLPASEIRRIESANFLVRWRFVLIPLVLLVSLWVARMLGRKRP